MQQHPGPGGMMLPGMMMPGMPGMMSMRPAPLGEISPSPRTGRRSRTSRSPSPEDRYRGGPYSPRSERRHSPARSDRGGYRDKGRERRESSGDREYSRRYRRDTESPRSDRSSRYSDREEYRHQRGPSHPYSGVFLF